MTFGYAGEEQVTFYDRDYDDPEPFEGWWEIYPPEQKAEYSAIIGIQLEGGSFYSFRQDVGFTAERGTYILTGDSVTITITESFLPNRVWISFTVTFSFDPLTPEIVFTNASMLTAGWTQEETISMGHARIAVRSATWGQIKSSHR
ncbi:MAG: hypothetical protein V1800_09890 [Candidatus Latescibacterota bacterium]